MDTGRHRGLSLQYLLFALSVVSVLFALGYLGWTLTNRDSTPHALGWAQLANATYPTELTRSKQVTLRDGAFEEPVAPGSASKVAIRLADIAGFGRIAGNEIDAAVVLIGSAGGTGTFINLVVVRNDGGTPTPVATALLGDRISVRGIVVEDRTIVVRMRVRGEGEPFSSLSREVTRTYALDGTQLVVRSEVAADIPAAPPADFTYRTTPVQLKAGGAAFTASDILGPGRSQDFVVHAEAGQRLKVNVQSEFNNAVLSIQGLGDLAQLVSRSAFSPSFSGAAPSTQDYVVRVISLAGSDLRFSVSISLGEAPASRPSPTATASSGGSGKNDPALPPVAVKGAFRPTPRPLDALATDAAQYAQTRSPSWGIALARPETNTLYSLNGDAQFELASVVKVLIMAAVMGRAEGEGRFVDDAELSLLWPMITQSDNDAATALWTQLGGGPGLSAYLKAAGFGGITPYDGEYWGTSTASANALANVLSRLLLGDLLRENHRKLALTLMEQVVPQQRWGVSAAAGKGDIVALKDGWYQADGGWRVNSIGVIVPGDPARAPYVVAILSNLQPSFAYGVETVEGIAQRLGSAPGEPIASGGR
ncbi:MAG: serine hydrolase [Dehalococcoidia bacterium]